MRILVSAGEPSGDQRAAEVIERLRDLSTSEVEAFGLGGEQLKAHGVEITHDMSGYAVMGFAEIVASLGRFIRLERELARLCVERKADLVLLVDYPGFNMRLGRKLRGLGFPVVHYIAPQMWAWGGWRVKKLRKSTDLLLTLFGFEEEYFSARGVNSVFTGHPLKNVIPVETPGGTGLGLLPGSRRQEVEKLLPHMLKAFITLKDGGLVDSAFLAVSGHLHGDVYAEALGIPGLKAMEGTGEVLRNSRAALVCSGTATLETALHGVPFAVCYKTGRITYAIARHLVKGVKRIGMANIVAGADVAPELIQNQVTSRNMAETVIPLLADGEQRRKTVESLKLVRKALGQGDPAGNAAGEILRFVKDLDEA